MRVIRWILPSIFIVAAATTGAASSLADSPSALDGLDPQTCEALDAQLARGSAAVTLFNDGSEAFVAAFRSGRHAEGCRAFLAVRGYVLRVSGKLNACAAARAATGNDAGASEDRALLSGFVDLMQQLDRVDRREACGPGS